MPALTSPFSTPTTCPLRSMFIASNPLNVRRAVLNESVRTGISIWHSSAISGSVSTLKYLYSAAPMNCPHCHSTRTTKLKRTTELGYLVFRCRECNRTFNERSGTTFNFLEVPTDIVFQVLLCRLRYKMSFRDVAEFFLLRGFEFTHETLRDWEARFAPIFAARLRTKRKGKGCVAKTGMAGGKVGDCIRLLSSP